MQASNRAAETPAQPDGDTALLSEADARFQRTMKIVVGVLGFLVIAALTAVVVRVIYLASRPATQPPAQAERGLPASETAETAAPAGRGRDIRAAQSLALPAGAAVRSVALSGDRLAVHYEVDGRAGVAILDLRTGRTITDVRIESGAAD